MRILSRQERIAAFDFEEQLETDVGAWASSDSRPEWSWYMDEMDVGDLEPWEIWHTPWPP